MVDVQSSDDGGDDVGDDEDDDEDDDGENSFSDDCDDASDVSNYDDVDDSCDLPNNALDVAKKSWKSLSPPITESELKGKWYGVIYRGGKSPMFYIAKLLMRELYDEDGPVKQIQLECLMPKFDSGDVLQAPPPHRTDIDFFPAHDIICGLLNVTPKPRSRAYIVNDYEKLKNNFELIKNVDLKMMFQHQ